jgi:Ca-activated chloride channel family protein
MNWNDPKLTAYALGELDGLELKEMEALVNNSEDARKYVEEVRQTAQLLQSELKAEPLPALEKSQREKLAGGTRRPSLWRTYWMPAAGLAVAAMLALVVALPMLSGGRLMIGASAKREAPEYMDVANEAPVASNAKRVGGNELAKREGVQRIAPNKDAFSQDIAGAPPAAEMAMENAAAPPQVADKKVIDSANYGKISPGMRAYLAKKAGIGGLQKMKGGAIDGFGGTAKLREGGQPQDFNTESYSFIEESQFLKALEHPLSTFSIDVDTASYSIVRRFLNSGSLPPPDAVRIEEMINYFPYDYAGPKDDKPFGVKVEQVKSPWKKDHSLVRIGIKARDIDMKKRPKSNLVFLIDVSGSMDDENKLPLLKNAMKQLVDKLDDNDRVAIVVYAGASGLVLPSTSNKTEILEALEKLQSGGSTNGGAGIELAYKTAQANFIQGGTNRVILATDGDFNVGTTSEGALTRLIEEKAKSKIFLSVLGFGSGNYKDSAMEKLADKGNGNYAYIDTANEAKKALVEQMGGTLVTVAKDVKIQVEFNPKFVAGYRLIGYENRKLNKEDFNDDTKDAGEIGAGHTVTALYEIVPAGGEVPGSVDALKYAQKAKAAPAPAENDSDELLTVKVRYKQPEGDKSSLIEYPVKAEKNLDHPSSADMHMAAAVAEFGMLLRDSKFKGDASFKSVEASAEKAISGPRKNDPYRKEFLELVKKAEELKKTKEN